MSDRIEPKHKALYFVGALSLIVSAYSIRENGVIPPVFKNGNESTATNPDIDRLTPKVAEALDYLRSCKESGAILAASKYDEISQDRKISFVYLDEIGGEIVDVMNFDDGKGNQVPQLTFSPSNFLNEQLSIADRARALSRAIKKYEIVSKGPTQSEEFITKSQNASDISC